MAKAIRRRVTWVALLDFDRRRGGKEAGAVGVTESRCARRARVGLGDSGAAVISRLSPYVKGNCGRKRPCAKDALEIDL